MTKYGEIIENDKDIQKEVARVNEDYSKAKYLLKDLFKQIYTESDIEWTEKEDKDIDFIFIAIEKKAKAESILQTGNILDTLNRS